MTVNLPNTGASNHWFLIDLVEKTFQGPLTLDDLKQNLAEGKAYWSDIALCPGKNFTWMRLFEIKELVAMCPPLPSTETLKHYRNIAFKQNSFVKLPVVAQQAAPPGSAEDETVAPVRPAAPAPAARAAPVAPVTPATPSKSPKVQVHVASPAPAPEKPKPLPTGPSEWHLLIDDNEGGPFTLHEIENAFKQGKKPDRAYVWRKSMKRWKPISQVPQFKHLHVGGYGAEFVDDPDDDEDDFVIETHRNMRRSLRKTFIASVMRVSENGIGQMIGVCGDITHEGLQLYQDTLRVEYPVKSRHLLEVRPLKLTKLAPFKVTAEVRWMNPDNHSIGFQFLQINPADQKNLQAYLLAQK